MNLRDKEVKLDELVAYRKKQNIFMSEDVNLHLANFVKKIVAAKNITKGKVFKILKEEFGEKK